MSTVRKLGALVRLHFKQDTQYPFAFYSRYLWIFLFCLTQRFFFRAALWQSHIPLGDHEISLPLFIMSGVAITRILFLVPSLFDETLTNLRQSGLMGWVLVTPTSLWEIFVSNLLWKSLVVSSEFFAVVFFAGFLIEMPIRPFFQFSIFLVILLVFLAYLGMGMILSALTLFLKKGTIVFSALIQVSVAFGGVFFPLQMLPEPVIRGVHFLPVTPALEIMRAGLVGVPVSELATLFFRLGGLTFVFLLGGTILLRLTLSYMRKQGRLLVTP